MVSDNRTACVAIAVFINGKEPPLDQEVQKNITTHTLKSQARHNVETAKRLFVYFCDLRSII